MSEANLAQGTEGGGGVNDDLQPMRHAPYPHCAYSRILACAESFLHTLIPVVLLQALLMSSESKSTRDTFHPIAAFHYIWTLR